MLLKYHIGFRGEAHSSSCRQAEGQEGPCCCKRGDDVDLRRLRQTMRLTHWSVCPSQVAPMTWGSVDLDDSVHRAVMHIMLRKYDTNCWRSIGNVKGTVSPLILMFVHSARNLFHLHTLRHICSFLTEDMAAS